MPKNIDDLLEHLFSTLAALSDKDHPMEIDRAKAIAAVGKVIVESAKVEVDFLLETGQIRSTNFLPPAPEETPVTRPPIPPGRRINGSPS